MEWSGESRSGAERRGEERSGVGQTGEERRGEERRGEEQRGEERSGEEQIPHLSIGSQCFWSKYASKSPDCASSVSIQIDQKMGRALFLSLFEIREGLIRGIRYFFDDGPPKPARHQKKSTPQGSVHD